MAIRHKRKASAGYSWSNTDLVDGQIGINTVDGTLHVLTSLNTIAKIGKSIDELLPSQSGQSGLFLTTNGSTATWGTPSGGGSTVSLYKSPVRVATTAQITLTGTKTIDGSAVVAGDRVLVKDQSDATTNGIYVVSASTWTRATDFDSTSNILPASLVPVTEGSRNGGAIFELNTYNPVTVGTNALTFGGANGIQVTDARSTGIPNSALTAVTLVGAGTAATSTATGATCVGFQATANKVSCTSIGRSATSTGGSNVAVGFNSKATASTAIAIGAQALSEHAAAQNFNASPTPTAGTMTQFAGEISFCTGQNGYAKPQKLTLLNMWCTSAAGAAGILKTGSGLAAAAPAGIFVMPNNSCGLVELNIIGRPTDSSAYSRTAAFKVQYVIRRGASAGSTVIAGTPVITVIYRNQASCSVAVAADTTNGGASVNVTGDLDYGYEWAATGSLTMMAAG